MILQFSVSPFLHFLLFKATWSALTFHFFFFHCIFVAALADSRVIFARFYSIASPFACFGSPIAIVAELSKPVSFPSRQIILDQLAVSQSTSLNPSR